MTKLKFTRRPTPVLPEHRPMYKIGQILVMLLYSRGGKSSLLRLHLLNWILKSSERIQPLRRAVQAGALPLLTWGFDPALVIALRFAYAERLVIQTSTGYKLEKKGRDFIEAALNDADILSFERSVLSEIGLGLTEGMVENVAKDWK